MELWIVPDSILLTAPCVCGIDVRICFKNSSSLCVGLMLGYVLKIAHPVYALVCDVIYLAIADFCVVWGFCNSVSYYFKMTHSLAFALCLLVVMFRKDGATCSVWRPFPLLYDSLHSSFSPRAHAGW